MVAAPYRKVHIGGKIRENRSCKKDTRDWDQRKSLKPKKGYDNDFKKN
jgi:hypothetical protein